MPLQYQLQISRTICKRNESWDSAQPMIVAPDSGPLHYLILLEQNRTSPALPTARSWC